MIDIVTWWWGDKYGIEYPAKLARSLDRTMTSEYRFTIFTDKEVDPVPFAGLATIKYIPSSLYPLLGKGCFIRLVMFERHWQRSLGFHDRIVNIDLDFVIIQDLSPLFDRPEPVVILQGANTANPCPYNGALFMLRAGEFPEVWDDFDLTKAQQIPYYEFPDDQGWIWHKLPAASGWMVGPQSGIYVYKKNQWPEGDDLPKGARAVTFIGKKNPKDLQHLPWVRDNWKV